MRNKITVKEFIKYLEDNKLATARLLTVLKSVESYNYYIEDITQKEFGRFSGAGKKTTKEFKTLKSNYMQQNEEKNGYDEMTREEIIERIRELEQQLHEEKKRLKRFIENTEQDLKKALDNLKTRAEWHEKDEMRRGTGAQRAG